MTPEDCRDAPIYGVVNDPVAVTPSQWTPSTGPDEAERIWARAVEGHTAEAYAGLAKLQETHARPDLPLRLYWLLALEPKLDAARSRYEWLAIALCRSRLRGPAAELYRRELSLEPALAVGGPFRHLLAQPANAEDLLSLARLRIAAAGRTGQFFLIEFDLRNLRKQLGPDSDAGWMSLLVAANDWAAWDEPADLNAYCRAEFAAMTHLELQHSHYWERIEEAEKFGGDCRAFQWSGDGMPEEFIRIVHADWANGTVSPAELAAGVADLAAAPATFLERFDRQIRKRGTRFATQAVNLLEKHDRNREPEYPPDLLRGLAHARLANDQSYDALRTTIFNMLLKERVHPEEFARAIAADPEKRLRKIAESIRADLSLRIVWLAGVLRAAP